MEQLGITNDSHKNFLGFDNAETGLEDSEGRPLVVGDAVKVLLDWTGDHEFEDPKYPDFKTYDKAIIVHNYATLYGGDDEDFVGGWRTIHNSTNGPRPIDGYVVLFDHHITKGEILKEWLHLQLDELKNIKQYQLYLDRK
jgi:hypothetical protein